MPFKADFFDELMQPPQAAEKQDMNVEEEELKVQEGGQVEGDMSLGAKLLPDDFDPFADDDF